MPNMIDLTEDQSYTVGFFRRTCVENGARFEVWRDEYNGAVYMSETFGPDRDDERNVWRLALDGTAHLL